MSVAPPAQPIALPRRFYQRDTETVARELLGKLLLRRVGRAWVGGMIVETEAYLAENDAASHSARGKTTSNASMFSRAGTLYVYPIHAKHCLNAVTETKERGCAVLIRAIEPLWGMASMMKRRSLKEAKRLTRGPGMLCQALDVDRRHDGTDLVTGDQVTVCSWKAIRADEPEYEIAVSGRVGIRKATDLKLRFFVRDNPFVSGSRKQHRES